MKAIQAFVFGNIYISLCAVVMVLYTARVFELVLHAEFYLFIFFASLTSYSFHWYLTPDVHSSSERYIWVNENKKLLLFLLIAGSCCSLIFIFLLLEHFKILLISAGVTFFYSANKIPFWPFTYLKKIIIGKTVYLAIVWTFVTAALPVLIAGKTWQVQNTFFCLNRFFLIYPICLLFDFRDKDEDKKQNILNIVGLLSIRSLRMFYYAFLVLFFISSALFFRNDFSLADLIILSMPGVLLLFSFDYSIRTRSDYWYYFYLDGLMMMSGILSFFIY